MDTHFSHDSVPFRKQIFDWIARHNPSSDNGACYLVIDDGEKIAAYEGRMPVDLLINGVKEKGYFFHDTLVHPEYRKKGLGLKLVNQLKSTWEDITATFAIGIWMNQFTHEILKRRGYYELNVPYYVKLLNVKSFLSKARGNRFIIQPVPFLINALLRAYDRVSTPQKYPDISVIQIKRFDQRFDDFANRVSLKYKIIVLRHSRYLNWKYVDKPSSNYRIYACERNNTLAGYIILLPVNQENIRIGVIVDMLTDPDDTRCISCLCELAVGYFNKEKADVISCVLTDPRIISVFKKHLFFKRNKTAPVMIGNLSKHHEQNTIKDINNWFLTCGDSDGFVWQ